jgi:glucokinase
MGLDRLVVLNDFTALALALPTLAGSDLHCWRRWNIDQLAVRTFTLTGFVP